LKTNEFPEQRSDNKISRTEKFAEQQSGTNSMEHEKNFFHDNFPHAHKLLRPCKSMDAATDQLHSKEEGSAPSLEDFTNIFSKNRSDSGTTQNLAHRNFAKVY
jgi:hypothetical protein